MVRSSKRQVDIERVSSKEKSQEPWCRWCITPCYPAQRLAMWSYLLASCPPGSLPLSQAPLTLCPALSRTPVISWGRGNRHHGLSCHPSSCTWPPRSPGAPLLQRTTWQREPTDRGQVGERNTEREKRFGVKYLGKAPWTTKGKMSDGWEMWHKWPWRSERSHIMENWRKVLHFFFKILWFISLFRRCAIEEKVLKSASLRFWNLIPFVMSPREAVGYFAS